MAVVAVDVRHARSTTQKAGRWAVDTAARDQSRLRTRFSVQPGRRVSSNAVVQTTNFVRRPVVLYCSQLSQDEECLDSGGGCAAKPGRNNKRPSAKRAGWEASRERADQSPQDKDRLVRAVTRLAAPFPVQKRRGGAESYTAIRR